MVLSKVYPTFFLMCGLVLSSSSCGYKSYQPLKFKSIYVPIIENSSERRTEEFTLTNLVIKELQLRGAKITNNASHELICEIKSISEPTLVTGRKDVLLVSSYSIVINMQLVDKTAQKPIITESIGYQAPFSALQGKTLDAARQEAMTNLAQIIATKLEASW